MVILFFKFLEHCAYRGCEAFNRITCSYFKISHLAWVGNKKQHVPLASLFKKSTKIKILIIWFPKPEILLKKTKLIIWYQSQKYCWNNNFFEKWKTYQLKYWSWCFYHLHHWLTLKSALTLAENGDKWLPACLQIKVSILDIV